MRKREQIEMPECAYDDNNHSEIHRCRTRKVGTVVPDVNVCAALSVFEKTTVSPISTCATLG